ncbi:hypothetical protein, partial [Anaerostipes hadrus]|uniref:hypothetical protein n=1 Tax=Anaerostipes hadrus TaxID=649756 RepID=UPI002ED1D18F
MDADALEKIILDFAKDHTPILGVVAVVGSTEEGAIDPVQKVVALRDKFYNEQGIYFYLHID